MNNFQAEFNELMHKHGLMDFTNWQHVEIDHSGEYNENIRAELRVAVPGGIKSCGVYVYTYLNNDDQMQVLYVGKSQKLPDRLFNHYKESHGRAGISVWPQFWGSRKFKMKIYFKEIASENPNLSEAMRIIVERWLIATHQPESEKTRKSIK